jgi:ribosomal protein L44E
MKCPKCEREDFFSISRTRRIVESRGIATKNKSTGGNNSGYNNYKGNWKQEITNLDKKMFLRCNACENQIEPSELEDISEVKIDKNKGVLFVIETISESSVINEKD